MSTITYPHILTMVKLALKEDLGKGDLTTNTLIDSKHKAQARIFVKEPCTVCGVHFMRAVFKTLDPKCSFKVLTKDGQTIPKGRTVATVTGKARALLTGERTALNFLGHLSGIATLTRAYMKKAGKKCAVLETRKTTPGLRLAEKYAVTCGGGKNHRKDLSEMIMVKDNHRALCQDNLSITEIIQKLRIKTNKKIVMEVDTWTQYNEALTAKPDIILLDNMRPAQLKKAVHLRDQQKGKKVLLEASGGITLKTIASVAQSGVERISAGALTHSPRSMDVSMEISL